MTDAEGLNPSDQQIPFKIEFAAPGAALRHHILTYYLFRSDLRQIDDIQRADVGQVMFFLDGIGEMRFGCGRIDRSAKISLFGPATAAAAFRVAGPFNCFGFGLSPIGWGALIGRPANVHADTLVDASAIFGKTAHQLHGALRAELATGGDDCLARMVAHADAFLAPLARRVSDRHRIVIQRVVDWLSSSLSPQIEALYADLPMSRRQAERVIGHYFGAPPRFLLRKFRASRAAALLLDGGDAAMTHDLAEVFYDQSHMINEIRHFTGRTPQRLTDPDHPILKMWLEKRNFRELSPGL